MPITGRQPMKSLQSHGLVDKVWYPPKTRNPFYLCEKSDEEWMRPLGLGYFETKIKPLFDVRLRESCDLVGYCALDPRTVGHLGVDIPILAQPPFPWCRVNLAGPTTYESIHLRVARFAFSPDECFLCWQVDTVQDAANLLRMKWIKLLGEDNIEDFIFNLEKKHVIPRLRSVCPK